MLNKRVVALDLVFSNLNEILVEKADLIFNNSTHDTAICFNINVTNISKYKYARYDEYFYDFRSGNYQILIFIYYM